MIAVWRVTGEAATDSSGGVETWVYVTPDSTALPDVRAPIRASGRRRDWYRVERVEHLGDLGAVHPDSEVGRALLRYLERPGF